MDRKPNDPKDEPPSCKFTNKEILLGHYEVSRKNKVVLGIRESRPATRLGEGVGEGGVKDKEQEGGGIQDIIKRPLAMNAVPVQIICCSVELFGVMFCSCRPRAIWVGTR